MDRAFQAFARTTGNEHLSLVRVYALRPDLLAVTQAWQPVTGESLVVAAKRAREAIADLCHLDTAARTVLLQQADRMADNGMRVLAVAHATAKDPLPNTPTDFVFTAGMCAMPQLAFQFANVASAIVWATGVLAPGILAMEWLL